MDRSTKVRGIGLRRRRFPASVAILALLSACGGGGGGGGSGGGGGGGGVPAPPPPPPPPAVAVCSLLDRQNWAFAQLNEWYLFPELMAANVNPADHASVQSYVDALVAPARAQNKDRFFTVAESLSASNAFFNSGTSAGFGLRFSYDQAAGRVFASEAFEGGPALAAGIDRGAEILAVGTGEADLKPVSELLASGGPAAFSDALGASAAGVSRVLRIKDGAGTRNVTVVKAEFNIPPVSSRYGAKVIDDGGKKVGYLNLRTFVSTADSALRNAFAQFKAQGINEVIVDFRYNSGGLIATGVLMNNLLLGQRTAADVIQFRVHRASKSSFNAATNFSPQPESIAAMKIAFIGTGATGSASEMVMNAVIPYLGANTALIGTNTFGKPVGQVFLDRAQCDDRIRAVAFHTQNANKQGDYFNGIASKFQSTCVAPDDLTRQLGDPLEGSVKIALDFLAGRPCAAPISGGGITAQAVSKTPASELIAPAAPTTVQREVPGFF